MLKEFRSAQGEFSKILLYVILTVQGTNNPKIKNHLKNEAKDALSLRSSLLNLGMTKKFPLSCQLTEHNVEDSGRYCLVGHPLVMSTMSVKVESKSVPYIFWHIWSWWNHFQL